jgi:fumarate reductase (CoM/CoB) subunit A
MRTMLETKEINTDVLIVGGGGAGAVAAIKAMAEGVDVLVVTKGPFPSGNTSIALAGYVVALGHADPRDNPDVHFEDVIKTGNGLNNRKVVRAWVREIVELTREMDRWGIDLVRDGGKLAQKFSASGGHTYPRHVHHYTTTGQAVMRCLRQKCKEVGVKALDHTTVGGLLTGNKGVVGAWGIQPLRGQLLLINAKAVVLTTGGMGNLFPITDNIKTITGEGFSMAFEAGAELMDMEMIHFLPTFCYPIRMKAGHVVVRSIVASISKGGVRLYNGLGERFMKRHYPETGEMGRTEKEITRSIGLEICEGRATPHGGVCLDVSDVPLEAQKRIFSPVWNKLEGAGVDLGYGPIEVTLNPHDILGGVRIDETAATNVQGLFAAGEAAGGAHGATRLGGSALSDALAFGAIAGRSAVHHVRWSGKGEGLRKQELEEVKRGLEGLLSRKEGLKPSELKERIQCIAHRYLNVVRNEWGLKKALQELEQVETEMLPGMSAYETDFWKSLIKLQEVIEVEGQLELAKLIATAALCRKESRGGLFGGHARSDYPSQDDKNWMKNVVLKSEGGRISCFTTPPIMEE